MTRKGGLLHSRNGFLFLVAQLVSAVGAGAASVALPWLVLDSIGSSSSAALVFASSVLPYVLLGLPAGLVGDRFERRRVIFAGLAAQAGFAAVIPVWSLWHSSPSLALIVLVAVGGGSARVFVDAVGFAMIAGLLGREQFVRGQAVVGSVGAVGTLIGPTIGGALVASIGAGRTLFVEAAAFAVACLAVAQMKFKAEAGSLGHLARLGDPAARHYWRGRYLLLQLARPAC